MPDYICERLRHTISFRDAATKITGAGSSIRNPKSAIRNWYAATPYVIDYEGDKANQRAHYMLRWVSTRGDKGPWSETVSATIGA
jgi:hypothetical protein